MVFKNGVKSIQAAAYNDARTVFAPTFNDNSEMYLKMKTHSTEI